jgi:hypothetical protein
LIRGRIPLKEDHINKALSSKVSGNFMSSSELLKNSTMAVLGDSSFVETQANIISISGCQDYDTSADAFEDNSPQGAMTWSFLASFDKSSTLVDLVKNMRLLLKSSGYWQVPQLTFGNLFNPNIVPMSDIFKI